jgi:hypothetical protein
MMDRRLIPDLNSMVDDMESYSTIEQLNDHLDDTIPNEVANELLYPDYEDED